MQRFDIGRGPVVILKNIIVFFNEILTLLSNCQLRIGIRLNSMNKDGKHDVNEELK